MEEDKKIKLSVATEEWTKSKTLLWDISNGVFIQFLKDPTESYYVKVIPEALLPPITKSDMIKRLKQNIEKEISIKYLGEELYYSLDQGQREYETFCSLYENGMRRINNPTRDDEKYYNRLYDRYYKRLLRDKKKNESGDKELLRCPYVFVHNGKKHKVGQVCDAPGKAIYGGFCSKHKVPQENRNA